MSELRSRHWAGMSAVPVFLGWRTAQTRKIRSSSKIPSNYKKPEVIAEWLAKEQSKCDGLTDVFTASQVVELYVITPDHAQHRFDTPGTIAAEFSALMDAQFTGKQHWQLRASADDYTSDAIVLCGANIRKLMLLLGHELLASSVPCWPASLWFTPNVCDIHHAIVPDSDREYVSPAELLAALTAGAAFPEFDGATVDTLTPKQQATFQRYLDVSVRFFIH